MLFFLILFYFFFSPSMQFSMLFCFKDVCRYFASLDVAKLNKFLFSTPIGSPAELSPSTLSPVNHGMGKGSLLHHYLPLLL